MAYKLSIPAAKDIENILQYTLAQWGEQQFERYYHLIEVTLNEIATDPECQLCRSREELLAGCFSRAFGSHEVFYRKHHGEVEIIRILHAKMDHGRHLR